MMIDVFEIGNILVFKMIKKLILFIKTQLTRGYFEENISLELLKCDYDYECAEANLKCPCKRNFIIDRFDEQHAVEVITDGLKLKPNERYTINTMLVQ